MKEQKKQKEKLFTKDDILKIMEKARKRVEISIKMAHLAVELNKEEREMINMASETILAGFEKAMYIEIANVYKNQSELEAEKEKIMESLITEILGEIFK